MKKIKKFVDKLPDLIVYQQSGLRNTRKVMGSQLSWESICLTSRGSQVRALQVPYILARQLSWLEHTVHTRSVEGSNPPLATKKNPKGFFFVVRIYKNLRHYGVVERAHEVRWTSAMRGPERSGDRIPLSLLKRIRKDSLLLSFFCFCLCLKFRDDNIR